MENLLVIVVVAVLVALVFKAMSPSQKSDTPPISSGGGSADNGSGTSSNELTHLDNTTVEPPTDGDRES